MGQRSTLCTHQMFDLDSEPSDSCLHHVHGFFTGNATGYASRNSHPPLSGPGNSADLFNQFRDYHERAMLYENQYINIQNCHTIQNLGLDAVDHLNFYNSNMLLATAGRNLPVHQSNVMAEPLPAFINQTDNGIIMDEYGCHNQLVDSDIRLCKRKDSDPNPGIYCNLNGLANTSSSSTFYHPNCGVPLRGHAYGSVPDILDPASLTSQEYRGRASLPGAEGSSHRSTRSGSVAASLQLEPAVPHQNYILPGSYMMHHFQPANNAWVSQFGTGNNIGDGGFTWNYNNTVRYLQGRSLNSGPLHQSNTNMQAYTVNSSTTNSPMLFHPSIMPNFHPAVHNVQLHGYHANIPAPYQHPINNLGSINSNLLGAGMNARPAFPNFSIGVDQIYSPRQLPQPAQQFISGSLRLLSAEDAALMDLTGFYEVGNDIDQHEDMRLDIDDMSYEELLALEEHIGVVKTGLAEEFIIEHLKIRSHVPLETTLSLEPSSRLSMDNETCSICQVEYEEDEIIGTLDCGHAYHGNCIKQWLFIKNLCPICKTLALAKNDRGES